MQIVLKKLGKKFGREWIFKGIDRTFSVGQPSAIIGPNGSGKSTLMLIISGWSLPSSGEVAYFLNSGEIKADEIYRYIDFIAPYTELIEELTLREFLNFHFSFKQLRPGINTEEVLFRMRLENEPDKYLRHFSSGMKQRLKLALGFYSESPILLLDEPTTNLDDHNRQWYLKEIKEVLENKIVIIASNQREEYTFADTWIDIGNYK